MNNTTELSLRKHQHVQFALSGQVDSTLNDPRFNYEPLFATHPARELGNIDFMGFKMGAPFWISSMTGGSELSLLINQRLAKLCGKVKIGMGLGSCRPMLNDPDTYYEQFALRKYLGNQPFFANLGIAQLDELLKTHQMSKLVELIKRLEVDGLIIHLNPLQEWAQDQGDRFSSSPLDIIKRTLDTIDTKIIIKEVGQGMGPRSLAALWKLPLWAIETASFGGTNFHYIEKKRLNLNEIEDFSLVGHTLDQMIEYLNVLPAQGPAIILSGGIKNFLDGYYFYSKLNKSQKIIGMASKWLEHALVSDEVLEIYFWDQWLNFQLAQNTLTLKENI